MSVVNPVTNNLISYSNKNECLKMIKVLNHNLKNFEKSLQSNLTSKKNDKDFSELYEIYITNESNRKIEKSKLIQKHENLAQMIFRFKQETKIAKPSQQIIDLLKSLMDQIDDGITDYKEEHHLTYEELSNEEKTLSKEIDVYDKKILTWTSNPETTNNTSVNTNKINVNDKFSGSELLKEVIDFDKFLIANGGHNGGWDEIDQSLFLKIRNKHKGKISYLNELEGLVATKTREQIEQHEEWYKSYLDLNELKKQAIKQWKENKMANKSEVVNLVDEELKLNKEIEKELKDRFKRKSDLEKQEKNKLLNKWRLERELEKAEEQEKLRKEEEKRLDREERERIKQEEIRRKVTEYKRQKDELNEYIEMEQYLIKEAEREIKSKNSKYEIANFQQRDQFNVLERRNKLKAKEKEKDEKQKRLERTKERVEVEYDPNRLYQMTSNWKNRVNTPRGESCGPILSSARMPHLAVPTWRQNV